MSRLSGSQRIALVVVLAVFGAVWLALSAGAGAGAPNVAGRTPEGDVDASQPVPSVDGADHEQLAVLRSPQTMTDQPPAGSVDSDELLSGANASLARLALRAGNGYDYYVVPANDGVCLASSNFVASVCGSADAVRSGALVTSVVCSPMLASDVVEIEGILPDGTSDLRAVDAAGLESPVALTDNVFVMGVKKSSPMPARFEWSDSSGREHSVEAPVPADAGSDACHAYDSPQHVIARLRASYVTP